MSAPAASKPAPDPWSGLEAFLEPGERVLWTGAPDPDLLGPWPRRLNVGALLVVASIPFGWGVFKLAGAHNAWVGSIITLVLALIFYLPALTGELGRRSDVYAITDRRAISWPRFGRGKPRAAVLPCEVGISGFEAVRDLIILSPETRSDGQVDRLFTFHLIADHDAAMRLLLPPGEHDRRLAAREGYLRGETTSDDEDEDED